MTADDRAGICDFSQTTFTGDQTMSLHFQTSLGIRRHHLECEKFTLNKRNNK